MGFMRAMSLHSSLFAIVVVLSTSLRKSSAFSPVTPLTTNSYLSNSNGLFSSLASSGVVGVNADKITSNTNENDSNSKSRKKMAVLLCPAQFCVPADYVGFLESIKSELQTDSMVDIVDSRVAPLPRTEWIKVARQLPTKNFLDANLSVPVTLDWYFEAMEQALAELFSRNGDNVEVCIIGHSIGGWVARAYLGGLSSSSTAVHRLAKERCTSMITLGTPHISPENALVDQTRGLLREIASSPECSSQSFSDRGVKVTCVGSSGLAGRIMTNELEEIIAATSYLPLVGKIGADVKGDGIVPTDLAFMEEPARKVEIEKCMETGAPVRHAHVLPTPWNLWDGYAPSLPLPDNITWYGSPGVLSQWLKYIE